MCEEESDDSEAVAKLLEINDSIHRTVERYKLVKKGDLDGAAKIPQGTLGTSTGVVKNANNELSLIDFGGDPEPASAAAGEAASSSEPPKATSGEDDLLGLSLDDKPFGQTGGIALGFGANTSMSYTNLWGTVLTYCRYPRTCTAFIYGATKQRQISAKFDVNSSSRPEFTTL